MKIAIITFQRAYNCGTMLQAWALQTALERLGHTASFPKCNSVGEVRRWHRWCNPTSRGLRIVRSVIYHALINLLSIPVTGLAQRRYRAFRHKYLHEDEFDRNTIADKYDLLVFGSDQIWRREHSVGPTLDIFFLRNGFGDNVKKIAYAASTDDAKLTDEEVELLTAAVPKYEAVSAREKFLADQLEVMFPGRKFPVVLDPTLLFTADDYRIFDCGCAPKGDYVFAYVLEVTPFIEATAKDVARRLGMPLILSPVYHEYSLMDAPREYTYGTSPDRFVTYVAHARYVLAQSFHGTVFSVIFGKQFLDLENYENTFGTRSGALLERIGLGDRMANPTTGIDEIMRKLTKPIDPSAQEKLAALRDESWTWLKNALKDVQR